METAKTAVALSRALSALGVPHAEPDAVEWMCTLPCLPLLHALSTALPPHSLLAPAEASALRTEPEPGPAALAYSAAAPCLADVPSSEAPNEATRRARERVRRLTALRDVLTKAALDAERRAGAATPDAFAGIDPEPALARQPDASAAQQAAERAMNTRRALAEPSRIIPAPAASSVAPALSAERRRLASVLSRAAEIRATTARASDIDAGIAERALEKYVPLLQLAAERGRSTTAGSAAVRRSRRQVAHQLAVRARTRHTAAVDATAEALGLVADLRVRLDVLARAVKTRRSAVAHTTSAANRAMKAAPQPSRLIPAQAPLDDSHQRVEAAFYDASAEAETLLPTPPRTRSARSTAPVQFASAMVARVAEAAARVETPSAVCTARGLELVQRAIAQNASALDALLRERRSTAPGRALPQRRAHELTTRADAAREQALATARYEAVLELHTLAANPRGPRLGHRDAIEGARPGDEDARASTQRSFRSTRALRSSLRSSRLSRAVRE